MVATWYIKKPQAPQIVEMNEEKSLPPRETNIEIFKNIPIETIKPQISPKPQIKTFQEVGTETATSEESIETLEIIITAKELRFNPTEITTKSNLPLVIIFKNEDNIPLDLKISNESWSIKSDLVAPGSTTKIEIKFPGPGEYEFYSTVPIAQEKNMKGKIIVK